MKFCIGHFFILCGIVSLGASFSWETCGNTSEPIKVLSLDIYSNKTNILYVTGRGKVAANITGPIQGQIVMQKKLLWVWTKIPCVDQVGSCTYDDICSLSPYIEKPCPSQFEANDIPCRCPIFKGQFMVKKFPVDLSILPQWIEEGSYRIQLILQKDEKEIFCLLTYITL